MSKPQRPLLSEPRIDNGALLGLRDSAEGANWGAMRAAQLNAARQLALFTGGANLICAALMILLFRPDVPAWQLMSWGATVASVALAIVFRRLARKAAVSYIASASEIRDTVLEGVALAAVWSVPPLLFAAGAIPQQQFGVCLILGVLMVGVAISMASLPLAGLTFLLVTGGAASAMIYLGGSAIGASLSLLFTGLLLLACFTRGKALVMLRASQIALAERDETVSMLLREFEDSGADWLWEIDAQRRVVRASPRFAQSIGVDPTTINDRPFLEVLAGPAWHSGDVPAGLRVLAEKLKGREAFRDLLLPVDVNGEERWWEMAASPKYDDRGMFIGFRGVGSDVTEARQTQDKINRMARLDMLTGLPNRLLINETLARAMADAERWGGRCAFMMIDLDRFKAVNDSLGHPIGDRLLGQVSERLARLVNDNEMVGRLGGDEFAVVVRDASDTARIEALAHTIITTLSQPYEVDHHTMYIGASVGVAIGPRDGRTAEMLIRSADLALYRSKDSGGGAYHTYEPQLHVRAEERRVLEIELRSALDRDELHLAYQPVVDAGTGALTGFEALLRWTHPEMGVISPAKFVPLAEDARLIAPIGDWVLRTACAEAVKWGEPVRVAVNVSAEQLHNPGFVNVVADTLMRTGLPPGRLELEVTESAFMREGTGAVQVLERILDLGVRLSLDDFGTGYSSLGYLSRTRFTSIKIDRSFVQAASKGEKEAIAIIRAVVALAQSLGMATTAEGVETEDEHRMVQALGCTKVQGYYFGRPLPVEEARRLTTGRDAASAAA
ncbi:MULTISPECIES: EAL domain-containing protein [unclassified Sphingomonas]|uniref:putative bifunctional diguanylate cyclase/phosphodiesterase n=1 Tax=unclassified Sphingomonas TaxID=196159 RepID=UPI000836524C